jgi:hypothetical protein
MMGPRTAHERLQNHAKAPSFYKKKKAKNWIYKREINRNCRIRVIYDEARDNVAPGDCENIRLIALKYNET